MSEEEIEEIEEHYWRGDAGDGRRRDARRPPTRKRFGQHFLEPAWVDEGGRARSRRSRTTTFLEIGPGRGALTRPLAARARPARRRSRSIATSPPRCAARRAAERHGRRGRLPRDADLGVARLAGRAGAASASPATCPTTSRRRSCSSCVELLRAPASPLADATRDAAARGRRPAGRRARARSDYGVLSDPDRGTRADVERLLTLPPGAFRPAAEGPLGASSGCASARRPRRRRRPRGLRAAWSQAIFTQRRKTLAQRAAGRSPARVGRRAGRRACRGRHRRHAPARDAVDRRVRRAWPTLVLRFRSR